MKQVQNLSLIFKSVPKGIPIPGKNIIVEARPIDLSDVPPEGLIIKNLYSSLDPYMRLMLIPPDQKHYREPFIIGEPLYSFGIGEVIASNNGKYPEKSLIRARLPIQQYTSFTASKIVSNKVEVLPASNFNVAAWLGPLGMPGQTAYSSIFEIGKPQAGETIFVSAASGAVGQLVGQICKKRGLRVIGSVGDNKKLTLIKDKFGFDDGFNYKEEDANDALTRLCPEGVDIYYDNVGGPQLEGAIEHMNKDGRIIVCGMVSQYNKAPNERYGIKNLFQFVGRSLTMRGFLVGDKDFRPKWEAAHKKEVKDWLDSGELNVTMSEVIGIENGAEAFAGMLEGKSQGKAVLRIWRGEDTEIDSAFHALEM